MRQTLPKALALMFGHEGGYTNNKADKGNWYNGKLVGTKYGITGKTLAAYRGKSITASDVRALTLAEAEQIYRANYWIQSGGDMLPEGLDYAAFDFGVNSGPGTAVRHLQRVVGVGQDGIVGAQTLAAIAAYAGGLGALIKAYCAERLRYMRSLSTWGKFKNGWTRRVDEVRVNAIKLAAGANVAVPRPSTQASPKANPADVGIAETLKKPEAWAPLGGLLSAVGGIAAGSGPIQWALAVVLVAAVGYGIYRLVKRDRSAA